MSRAPPRGSLRRRLGRCCGRLDVTSSRSSARKLALERSGRTCREPPSDPSEAAPAYATLVGRARRGQLRPAPGPSAPWGRDLRPSVPRIRAGLPPASFGGPGSTIAASPTARVRRTRERRLRHRAAGHVSIDACPGARPYALRRRRSDLSRRRRGDGLAVRSGPRRSPCSSRCGYLIVRSILHIRRNDRLPPATRKRRGSYSHSCSAS